MVVIMMGRKRSRQASRMASCGDMPRVRSASMAKSTIMMAFFLTMPISSTMPTSATSDRSMPQIISASSAPMPADGQRGQDGDRVDPAFVEHAQHDVDHHDRGQDQPGFGGERGLELGRVAGIAAGDRFRHADVVFRRATAATAWPSE